MSSLAFPGSAAADNYSGASGGRSDCTVNPPHINGALNMQDPNPHTYYYSNLEHVTQIHIDHLRASVIDPTAVDTTYPGGVSSLTDVVVYDQDYSNFCFVTWHSAANPGGAIGSVVCVSLAAGNRCEKHEQRHDTSWWLSPNVTNQARRHNACHEGGHTLGLHHAEDHPASYQTTCMRSGQLATDFISWHDMAHLNGGSWQLRSNGEYALPSTLAEQQIATSPTGQWDLAMQGDGNLVLYGPGGAVWASDESNTWSNWAVMQSDGNFVQYASDGWGTWAVCSTRTQGNAGAWLKVQDDGNLVIANAVGGAIWTRFAGGDCWR